MNILPENERNDFAGAERILTQNKCFEEMVTRCGVGFLRLLRALKSEISVGTLIRIYILTLEDTVYLHLWICSPLKMRASSRQAFDEYLERCALATIKVLANDGFIKLSSAESFESRQIIQYVLTRGGESIRKQNVTKLKQPRSKSNRKQKRIKLRQVNKVACPHLVLLTELYYESGKFRRRSNTRT